MVETKRKSRVGAIRSHGKKQKTSEAGQRRGPRLPSRLLKNLSGLNRNNSGDRSDSDGDERSDSDNGEVYAKCDVYEYEEGLAEEETTRNRRFDPVENLQYEMPKEFEDENLSSDEEIEDGNAEDDESEEKDIEDEDEEEDGEGRHVRMLQTVTGMPGEAFEGKKKRQNNAVIAEAYHESEYNPSRDVLDGGGKISVATLVESLQGKSGYSQMRKRIKHMDRKESLLQAPIHKAEKDRLERTAAFEHSKKDLYKWEGLIKRNREASTMIFDDDISLGFCTVGAIASEFQPRTEFEKKIASLVRSDEVMNAYKDDGSRLLELNEVSLEDERERQNRVAKMRSLLFRHETKSKHIKKIKSKAFHRLLKKDKLKAASSENQTDPEAAQDLARKHEYDRAKERMTLRHKSGSKWAQRIKERGLDVQDEGTRAAIAERQNLHAALTRKMRSMGDSSSDSEETDDEDESDDNSSALASKLIPEAKEKTLGVLNEENEVPNAGLHSLPFMMRGMKKRNEAAVEEAKLALEDLDSLAKQLQGSDGAESPKPTSSSGRMVFNAAGKPPLKSCKTKSESKTKKDRFYDDSDPENDFEVVDDDDDHENVVQQKDVGVDSDVLREASEARQDALFKSFEDIAKDPGPKTTHEVGLFASGTWKKVKGRNNKNDASNVKPPIINGLLSKNEVNIKETANDLSDDSGSEASYELPSQAELIEEAFAADDVADEFAKQKEEILNQENPEPEKPVLVPGWGQWTKVQEKRGLPAWMVKEHDEAKKKRQEAINKRKDANLKHVIISERIDKRAEKFYTKKLPFPYPSKEAYEQSIRMPLGPEFNPATTVAALNRPNVMKRQGQMIKPIQYEEVNPHKGGEIQRHGGHLQKPKKNVNPNTKQKKKKKKKEERKPV